MEAIAGVPIGTGHLGEALNRKMPARVSPCFITRTLSSTTSSEFDSVTMTMATRGVTPLLHLTILALTVRKWT